jgi:methylthioribose-1-phosphate isomerase
MPEPTVRWVGGLDGQMELIDQTLLPTEYKTITCCDIEQVREAITTLRVRGAPAIGVAAAMGVVVGARSAPDDEQAVLDRVRETCDYLATSRPTAVNLFWALERMRRTAEAHRGRGGRAVKEALLAEAKAIRDEDNILSPKDAASSRIATQGVWRRRSTERRLPRSTARTNSGGASVSMWTRRGRFCKGRA